VAKDDESFKHYLDEWVYGVPTHEEYLNRVGAAALLSIKANPVVGYAQGLDRK
jgi:glutaconate CoA-transferase subunit A